MADTTTRVKTIHISDYLFMLKKHSLMIIICFVLGLSGAFAAVNLIAPGYEATARLTIKPVGSSASLSGEGGGMDSLFFQDLNLKTHLQLMTSRPVLERVITELKLDADTDTDIEPGVIRRIKDNVRLLLGRENKQLTPDERMARLVKGLRDSIKLNAIRYTTILEITVSNSDPELARNIANTLVETYIKFDIGNNQQASKNSFQFLSDQAADFKVKLEDAEEKFLAYKQKENLFSITGLQDAISEKISEYNGLAVEARNKLQQLTMRLSELEALADDKKPDAARLRSLLANPVIDNLNEQLINAQIERSKLLKVYRSKHAKVVVVQSSINDLRQELQRQVQKELANMIQQKVLLESEEKNLLSNIEDLKNEAMAISRKELQYSILERNVATYQQYYDTLMVKLEDSSVSSDIRNEITSISFVERAKRPIAPVKPDKKKILLAGLFGGLFGGIALAFLLEFSDRSIRTEEDIQSLFDLPVIGVIPIAGQGGNEYGYRAQSSTDKGREA